MTARPSHPIILLLALVACDGGEGRRRSGKGRRGRDAGEEQAKLPPPREEPREPDAGRPPPAPPRVSVCTAEPAGGITVVRGRGRPSIATGRSGALVVHRTRERHNWELGRPTCEWMDAVVALDLPIGRGEPREIKAVEHGADCSGHYPDPIRVLRVGEEAIAVDCDYMGTVSWSCGVLAPFSPSTGNRTFGFPDDWSAASMASAFGSAGGTLFGAAVTNAGRLVGFVGPADGPVVQGSLGGVAPSVFSRSLVVQVDARSATEAGVTWMGEQGPAYQLSMDVAARALTPATRVARPAASGASFWIEERRPRRRGAPRVVGGHSEDHLEPVAGLDPETASGSPAFARAAGGWILAWVEGTDPEARVRVGRLDPQTLSVSAIGTVSSDGRSAGAPAVDASGDQVVVAWEEKAGEVWEVRAAGVRCP